MWLLFAFSSALFAGLTSILAKIGIKNIDSNVATAIRTIIILIFAWIMVFITKGYTSEITIKSIIFLTFILIVAKNANKTVSIEKLKQSFICAILSPSIFKKSIITSSLSFAIKISYFLIYISKIYISSF